MLIQKPENIITKFKKIKEIYPDADMILFSKLEVPEELLDKLVGDNIKVEVG